MFGQRIGRTVFFPKFKEVWNEPFSFADSTMPRWCVSVCICLRKCEERNVGRKEGAVAS